MSRVIAAISGPSQVGKNTTISHLVEKYGYQFVTTYTTRPPRPGEKNGIDYHFMDTEAFRNAIRSGFFVDWDWYGTTFASIESATDSA